MPRGVQKSDEERLQMIKNNIQEMETRKAKIMSKIANLNNRRKELTNKIEQKKLIELSRVIEQSGKTPEDIVAMLKQK